MRVLRGFAGALLWILASLLGLVSVLLCATVILLPLGIPLLMVTRRLFGASIRLFLPAGARHPLKTSGKASKSVAMDAAEGLSERVSSVLGNHPAKTARKKLKKGNKRLKKVANA
jgi:hypothetical protein